MQALAQLDVLVVDCQATTAAPGGHLLELGWARVGATVADARAHLIALPAGASIPPAVARVTGITDLLLGDAIEPELAWRALAEHAAQLGQQPAPTVIHFARFERPFLDRLAGGAPPLDVVCTHEIARRLLPDLPRRGLRAVAGYFGRAVGALRRSGDHVEATAFVWQELVRLLDADGVSTWGELHAWLAEPVGSRPRARRVWPMPREARLSLPDAPGVYRFLRTSGDVLYVGKAASLHHRVNSYFQKQSRVPERMLEMLSQARAISFEVAASALEAALREPDEIKLHRPPYNVALTENRALWFTSPDLDERSARPSPRCPLGPFPAAELLDQFAALARADRAVLARGPWGPDPAVFDAGYARLRASQPVLALGDLPARAGLLRLGTRLWREGRRDRAMATEEEELGPVVEWTPELVQSHLEWIALRAALARRRAIWLTRLVEATVVWREPGATDGRLLVVEDGAIGRGVAVASGTPPPVPAGHARPVAARREVVTLACFDRLRVLTSELKRLVAAGAPVSLRLGTAPPLADARLAAALSWV